MREFKTHTPEPPRYVGHFRIIEELGSGGMGVVYKAHDTRLDRLVALKLPHVHLGPHGEARVRLFHEAKAASALDHPNIATIYEINTTTPSPWEPEGRPYIVMAYYAGETLANKIERGPVAISECLNYATQIAQGLSRAHRNGIIHRDIKPANLIVTNEGMVKIVDFGLARVDRARLTRSGAVAGTIAYMSPEQTRGEAVDCRTDLWSLGVVLYEMLTGRRPFPGAYEQAVAYGILNVDAIPVLNFRRNVPAGLSAVVSKCLQKDPDGRYQTALGLRSDLKRIRAATRAAA